jgi:hypothetical protein
MSTTHCRPQQQTLSIRISESLREFLELSRQILANGRGDAVSISDVAKRLLESAKEDRLDFRLEIAELQQSPTEALAQMRRKWQQQQPLSRAEWVFLGQYIQIACEDVSRTANIPSPDSFIAVLEALLAVRSLRTDRGGGLDRFYLGNLGVTVSRVFSERQFDPDLLQHAARGLILELRDSASPQMPVFAGRNLYVALRDEVLSDVVALNRSLEQLLGKLFRLAARGYWIRERRPLRMPGDLPTKAEIFERSTVGPFQVTASMRHDGELELLLTMQCRGVRYPIGPYPEIREWEAILRQLEAGSAWEGIHFCASSEIGEENGQRLFHFYRRADRIRFTFTAVEWQSLKEVFSDLLATPDIRSVMDRMSLEFGDL